MHCSRVSRAYIRDYSDCISLLFLWSQHKDDARRFYVAMADEGGTMQKGLDEVLETVKNSDLGNLKFRYEDRSDTESHWSIFHSEALIALRWLLPVPAPEYLNEPDPWYLIEGANPPGWDSQKSTRKASSDSDSSDKEPSKK